MFPLLVNQRLHRRTWDLLVHPGVTNPTWVLLARGKVQDPGRQVTIEACLLDETWQTAPPQLKPTRGRSRSLARRRGRCAQSHRSSNQGRHQQRGGARRSKRASGRSSRWEVNPTYGGEGGVASKTGSGWSNNAAASSWVRWRRRRGDQRARFWASGV